MTPVVDAIDSSEWGRREDWRGYGDKGRTFIPFHAESRDRPFDLISSGRSRAAVARYLTLEQPHIERVRHAWPFENALCCILVVL